MFPRLFCVLLLSGCVFAQPSPPSPPKGLINGKVIHAVSKEPIKRVTVMLLQPGSAIAKPVTAESDDEGQFEFRDLAAGKYMLMAEKQGFARQAYGARGNLLSGTTLSLANGEELRSLRFECQPNAVISGKVLDDGGEPAANMQVMALRTMFRRGKKEFLPAGAAMTNDLGEYRVANLGPGRYLVIAVYRKLDMGLAGASQAGAADKPRHGTVTTFYPNCTEAVSASPVEAGAGAEVRGIEIRLSKSPVVSVKGKLTGATLPLSGQTIAWLSAKGLGLLSYTTRQLAVIQPSDGTFEFRNVPAGNYVLTASAPTSVDSMTAAVPVAVGESSIEGLMLPVAAGLALEGSVTIAGDEKASAKGAQILLESMELNSVMPKRATVAEDGKFTVKDVVPDRYLLHVNGGPEGLYIKSIRYGNEEALEDGLELIASAGAVEVKMSADGGAVEGVVMGADDKPFGGASVALIPDSKLRSRFKNATTDQKGTFSLKGVAPGSYRLYVWESVELGAYEDPELLKKYESKAQKVTVKERGRETFTLKPIVQD